MHRAVSGYGSWFRVYPISRNYLGDVRRRRRRYEHALSVAKRATSVASARATTRSVDAAREAVDGFSVAGDATVSLVRAWGAARFRGRYLGELFSSCDQYRLLDERCVRCPHCVGCEANDRARAYAPTGARGRRLSYRG